MQEKIHLFHKYRPQKTHLFHKNAPQKKHLFLTLGSIRCLRMAVHRTAFNELPRKDDVLHLNGIRKEWSNLLITESCYTTTYTGDEEGKVSVLFQFRNPFGGISSVVHNHYDLTVRS